MTEPPAEAHAVFGRAVDTAVRFVELLAGPGVERGLIGPREAPRLWDRHVLNCAALAGVPLPSSRLADLGSGAGLPGLVLAIVRPDVAVTLVEPLLRRSTFLTEAVQALGLSNVLVVRERAEALAGGPTYDVVTARALAPLSRLIGWAMPLVAPGGELVAMKGRTATEEIQAARAALRRAGCADPLVDSVTAPRGSSTATVVRVARGPR